MESSIKHGKHVEGPINEDHLDRISKLPDELLGHMLSFVPTKYAVGASILSKRWRYLFTLTNCLYFDYIPSSGPSKGNEELEAARHRKFKEFVNKVLELHQISPIKKFSLVCRGACDDSNLEQWVSKAVQKGVQDLLYQVSVQNGHKLPHGLFMCEATVRLKLTGCSKFELNLPVSASLPSLKILHLNSVSFSNYESMGRLFSGCELLEDLTLDSCDCDTGCASIISTEQLKVLTVENCFFEKGLFEIDAPNLAYLTYRSNIGVRIVPSWNESDSLVKADLQFNYSDDEDPEDTLEYDCELLKAAACKVITLSLQSESGELLLELVDQEQMPKFNSLLTLNISDGSSSTCHEWRYLSSLLHISPRLETISIHWCLGCFICEPLPDPVLPCILFSCPVKVISVKGSCDHVSLLHLCVRNEGELMKEVVRRCI